MWLELSAGEVATLKHLIYTAAPSHPKQALVMQRKIYDAEIHEVKQILGEVEA